MEAEHNMARRIQLRRDTAVAWTAANPVLAQGEIGLDLTSKKIKIGDGVTLWNALAYWDDKETNFTGYATTQYVDNAVSNNSIDISDFGVGFANTLDNGKITTSKLYNENPNQGLNNQYELGVTNGGVVTLPDGSIINGATLKTVAGNYAGITAGPQGADEDSWVWVDNNGATIATKYSTDAHTWTFNNSGALTFPQGTTIATADGTDAFIIDGAVDKDIQIYTYSGPTLTAHGWTFGADGTLTLPAGGAINNTDGIKLVTDRGTLAIGTNMEVPGVAGHFHIAFDGSNNNPPSSDLFLGDDYNYVKLPGYELNPADYGVEIGTHNREGGDSHLWRFSTDGSITFPDNTVQTTAYTGQGGGTTTTDLWIAAGSGPDGSAILHSTDGATWTTQDFLMDGQSIDRVAISSDRIVYLMSLDGPGSAIYYASAPEDTPIMAAGTDSYGPGANVYWSEINYLGGKFVAVGSASYNGNTVSSSITAVTLAGGGRTYPRITLSNINYNFSGETITITGAANTELNGTFVLEYNSLDTLRTGVYELTLDDGLNGIPTITSTNVSGATMADLTNINGRIPIFAYSTDGIAWTYGDIDPGYVSSYGGAAAELEMSDVAYDGTGYLIPVTSGQFGEFGDGGAALAYGPGAFYITDLTAEVSEGQFISGNDEGGLPGNFNNIAAYGDGTFFVSDDQYTVWTGNPNIGWTPYNIISALVDAYGWEPEINGNDGNDVDSAVAGTVGGTEYWVGTTNEGMVISTSDQCDTFQVSIPDPLTSIIDDIIRGTTTIIEFTGATPAGDGEKIVISGVTTQEGNPGETDQSYNGTYYIKYNAGDYELYTDSALTTPWNTTTYWPVNTNTGTITWGHGEDLDSIAIGDGVCVVYSGEADKLYRSTDLINWTAFSINGTYGVDDIYYGTRTTTTSNTLVNGDQEFTLNTDGSVTFPDGSIQTTAYTQGDGNVWVQTFETMTGEPIDTVVLTNSVEYLDNGDIVAVFGHFTDTSYLGENRYNSIARLTPAGEKVWSMSFTGAMATDGWGLAVDNVNGFIYVAGAKDNGPGYEVAILTKLAQSNGAISWSKIYDVGFDNTNLVVDVGSDGNPIVVGYANSGNIESGIDNQIVTTKIDAADGLVIWSRALDGQNNEEAYGMAVGPNGEVVAVGWMDQLGVVDGVATLYADNNLNWTGGGFSASSNGVNFTVGVTNGVATFSNISDTIGNRSVDDVIATINGSIFGGVDGVDDMVVKVGTLAANDTDDRMLVVKYDSTGSIQWQKAVQVDADYNCRGADADIDSAGNIYVCGNFDYSGPGNPSSAMIIIKFNSQGVKQWTRKVQGPCQDFASSIVVGPDDCLYLSAFTADGAGGPNTDYSMVVAKYNLDGTVAWQRVLDSISGSTFAGGFFFGPGGGSGSTIAVRSDYVAVAGGFARLMEDFSAKAIVAQFGTDGKTFTVGDYIFEEAGFTGLLNTTASNIQVVNAGKTSSDYAEEITENNFDPAFNLASDLVGTVYRSINPGNELRNNTHFVRLNANGSVTLPAGGKISEAVVTSNPTIQLTPARPDVASQKLVIKGGSPFAFTDNGIEISYYNNTVIVDSNFTFYVDSSANANQTVYWWIYPENVGVADVNSGSLALDVNGEGTVNLLIENDDHEFRIRVSTVDGQYDPASIGVQSGLINPEAPTFDGEHHLHLTTGELSETSIFLGTDNHNVRTTVDGGIQVTTQTTTVELPHTITITGADVAAVNLVYTRAEGITPPTWTLANPIGQGDPNIQFVDGQWGIFAPDIDPVVPIYVNTGTLATPLALWNTNPPYGSSPPLGVYTYLTPPVHEWTFGIDGALTLPTGGHIGPSGGKGAGTTYGGANDHLVSLTSYYDSGLYSSCVTAYADGTLNITAYNDGGPNPAKIWTFDNTGTLTFPDNTVQTTAYTGNTTVAKDGPTLPTTTGVVDTLSHDSVLTGLTNSIYGPFTRGVVTFSVTVSGGVINSFSNITVSGTATVNDVLGTIDSGDIGGTAGTTITITVNSVVQATPVAIDLTKTVNKLADGSYTLANGVEGQILYLVRQNVTISENVFVDVENGDGDNPLRPFMTNGGFANIDNTGICTLIFTDGTWKQTGGLWD